MVKRSKEKKRKYSFLLIIAVGIVFFTAIFAMYHFSAEDNVTYFAEDDGDLALVSVSPWNEAGVSEDSQIVIEWNHAVSAEAGNAVEITPSLRGDWSAAGNRLIFTPQQLAAGTYYTVFLPRGTSLNYQGDILSEDLAFSFETEDTSLRIPDTESFSVGGSQYHFFSDDLIAIPVSCLGEDDFDVDVSVYRAEDAQGYIAAFAKLFTYPSWAQLTVEKFRASLRNFEQISESAMAVQTENGTPCVVLGSLPKGAYLVRMTAANSSYDLAVTVGDMDQTVFYDGKNLNLWCHQEDARLSEGTVKVARKSYDLDENGFVSIPFDASPETIANNPSQLGITVFSGDEEAVCFVAADDLKNSYRATLVVDQTTLKAGADLTVSGRIAMTNGVFGDTGVTLTLTSDSGVLDTVETQTENGCFSYTWKETNLPIGDYRVNLIYDGKNQASTDFFREADEGELYLVAKSDVAAVESGGRVTYTVTVLDRYGKAVDHAAVTMNGSESKNVSSGGTARFTATYEISKELPLVQKNAVFSVTSPYGTGEDVTVSVAVVSERPFLELTEASGTVTAWVYRYEVDDGALEKEKCDDNRVMITVAKDGEKLADAVSTEKTAVYDYSWDNSAAGSYSFTATAGNASASLKRQVAPEESDTLRLFYDDGLFRGAMEAEPAAVTLGYADGAYTFGSGAALSIEAPSNLTSSHGKDIVVNAVINGAAQITVVSLYKGALPLSSAGVAVYGEGLYEIQGDAAEENRVFFGDEAVNAAFSGENRDGDYYIRLWSQGADGNTVSRYIPVSVDGVTLLRAYEPCYIAGKDVSLPFYLDSQESLGYKLILNDDLSFAGDCEESFTVDTDITEAGAYSGTLRLTDGRNTVASLPVNFTVYEKEPAFYEVSDGYAADAKIVFSVAKSDAKAVKTLFAQALEPGDQMLQRMGRTLFFGALGENAAYLAGDINDDLLLLQNSDGGFGRYQSSESDLLLSVFAAAQESFHYDEAALKRYILYRLSHADNQETAALACWGLSCFGVNCEKSMAELADDKALTLRGKLYLAEAYLAAGDQVNGEAIYKQLKRELVETDGSYHFNDSNAQFNIANTAFMYHIAVIMDQEERDGLLAFLLAEDIQSQTGRYLLELGLLDTVDTEAITVAAGADAEAAAGAALISLLPSATDDITALKATYTVNGEVAESLSVGDVASINISWESAENSIFLVYMVPNQQISWIEKTNMNCRKGYWQWITAENSASVNFRVTHQGSFVSPTVYIIDLTTGGIVGSTAASGIEVKQ
ncbi:MAG TPA: Ig-like domain-containing protein [Clostridiales bacterium]|nr:Ig-like domain-containing protein [Clostridiales bacterium]